MKEAVKSNNTTSVWLILILCDISHCLMQFLVINYMFKTSPSDQKLNYISCFLTEPDTRWPTNR